ncbi:MAG: organomercurial lyase [Solirubrobacteraceae bacterium]
MTCDSCATHVRDALEHGGARDVRIDWRRGTGTIGAGGPRHAELNAALAGTRYRLQRVSQTGEVNGDDPGGGARGYDLVVLGSGGAAFAAAIRARDLGRRAQLAAAVGLPEDQVATTLERFPGAYRDDQNRVTGFDGMTPIEMGHHRLDLDERTVSAWCALDTLFLPDLLGETVHVTSRCPVTGQEISLTVGADGVSDVHPTWSGRVVDRARPAV